MQELLKLRAALKETKEQVEKNIYEVDKALSDSFWSEVKKVEEKANRREKIVIILVVR